jgi:hypothetical protein
MTRDTNDIEATARHVVKGRRIVNGQRRLVDRLIADGHDASAAQCRLDQFTRTLAIFEDHLRELRAARGYVQYSRHGPAPQRPGRASFPQEAQIAPQDRSIQLPLGRELVRRSITPNGSLFPIASVRSNAADCRRVTSPHSVLPYQTRHRT